MRCLLICATLVGICALRVRTSEEENAIQPHIESNALIMDAPRSSSFAFEVAKELSQMNDSSVKELMNVLKSPESEQSDSCKCLNWKHLLQEGSATCADFPGYCKAMFSKDNHECIGFCLVSRDCEKQIMNIPEREIGARFCSIPRSLNHFIAIDGSPQNAMDLEQLGDKFTKVNSDMDVFALPFFIDEKTKLRRYTNIKDVYAFNTAMKTFLMIWGDLMVTDMLISHLKSKEKMFGTLETSFSTFTHVHSMHPAFFFGIFPSQPLTVLIVSIGYGKEFESMKAGFPQNTKYFGCDISAEILSTGMQRLSKSGNSDINLCICDGQMLPYKDNVFDFVAHIGSVNAWPSISKGLAEFHRVLKPGGLVSVVDEAISDAADPKEAEMFKYLVQQFGNQTYFNAPVEFLPKTATKVKVRTLNDFYYHLSFSK